MPKNRTKNSPRPVVEEPYIKDFLDMVAPSVIDFKVDHYLCGNTCRCVWALREYPTSTDEQAILRHLGEMDGVTIRIYTRQVTPSEERRIIHNAANKHRMSRSSTEDLQQTVTAEANLQDVVTLVSSMHRNREPLLHCAVFLELTAPDYDALKLLQTDVLTELVRSKLNVDRLMLRQQEGFISVMPAGRNAFGAQFERVLPASSVANLYPFNYSGKTDPHGFYIGKDKYGANILVDFDKRDDDKTSANILILGNSGQGKSYLLKLLLLNFLEAGKSVISLDVEHEQKDMCETVGGCFMDLMGGVYRINPLEPKCWDDGSGPEDRDAPEAFRKSTRLSQHISFLKDFFRAYKDFSDRHIDAIEIMVGKLYAKWGISDSTNFAGLKPQDYHANRTRNLQRNEQWRRLVDYLYGRNIELQTFGSIETRGIRPLREGDLTFSEEIILSGHGLNFQFDFTSDEAQREVLGPAADCLEPGGWLDILCNYDAARQEADATLSLTLHRQDGVVQKLFTYPLGKEERALLRKQMEADYLGRTGKTLNDYYAQLDMEREAPPELTAGTKRLPVDAVSFTDEITECDGKLNFYIPINFDPDAVFGTNVASAFNDDWLNVYANFGWKTGRIDSALTVCLVCSDGHEFEFFYPLTSAEQVQLWNQMDAYCHQQNGQSLGETRTALLREQAEEGLEIRL